MSAADVIAEAWDAHGTYRLVGNPAKPSGWLCKCGVQCKSPAERAEHRSSEAVAALSAAGYVVATPEEIRAWPVEQQAELIGGTVEKMMKPEWYDSGEPAPGNWPINAGRRMANGNRSDLRFVPSVRVVTPYEPEVRDDL